MSKVTMKIKLSPTKAGELYMKWSNLVEEVKALEVEKESQRVEIAHHQQYRGSSEGTLGAAVLMLKVGNVEGAKKVLDDGVDALDIIDNIYKAHRKEVALNA
jgi:hypothetical protein